MGFHFQSFVMQLPLALFCITFRLKIHAQKKTLNVNQILDLSVPLKIFTLFGSYNMYYFVNPISKLLSGLY